MVTGEIPNADQITWTPLLDIAGCHKAVVDTSGTFIISDLPPGRWVLYGGGIETCLKPTEVTLASDDTTAVQVPAVSLRRPHAQIMVHGGSWVPGTYEQLQCAAAWKYFRNNPHVRSLAHAPRIPSPDSIVTLVLESDLFNPLLEQFDPVRLKLWYGTPDTREGTISGKRFVITAERADAYILVHDASTDSIDFQVGARDEEIEHGLRVTWDLKDGLVAIVNRWP